MATLAELDAQIAGLDALPPGVLVSTYQGRSVTFDSLEARATERARLQAEREALVVASGGEPRPRVWRLSGSKGTTS